MKNSSRGTERGTRAKEKKRNRPPTLKILLRILTHRACLARVRERSWERDFYEWILYLVSAHIFHLSCVSFIQWVLRLLMHFTTCNVVGIGVACSSSMVKKREEGEKRNTRILCIMLWSCVMIIIVIRMERKAHPHERRTTCTLHFWLLLYSCDSRWLFLVLMKFQYFS